MPGIWQRLFGTIGSNGGGTSIALKTKSLGLKRGDFCRVISTTPGLRRNTEVMISTVYRDLKNVDVIDYNHQYHKVNEFNLRKL